MKKYKIGDIIYVKNPIEGYYSNYGITPKFFLTPDLSATIIDPEAPCVWVRKNSPKTFICVEFFSPVTNDLEKAAIFDRNEIKE